MPEKKKTIPSNYGLAVTEQLDNSKDMRLFGLEKVKGLKCELNSFSLEEALLQNNIKTKQNFFYTIQSFNEDSLKRELLFQEYGVGELYKKGRGVFLKREHVLYKDYGDGPVKPFDDSFMDFPSENLNIVWSYVPTNHLDLYAYPYSVLCSIERGVPTPVELEENTLLGRLDDTIQSIDKNELRRILTDQAIVDAINQTESPINLKSNYLELNNDSTFFAPSVSFKAIYTNKKKPPKPARGTIIFNDQAGCFEGFDGVSWKKLKWGDE